MIGYQYNDGGREAAGFRGKASDCVVRALAIMTGCDYRLAYDELAEANKQTESRMRKPRKNLIGRSANKGVYKKAHPKVFEEFGLRKVTLKKGSRPTYSEAYEIYGDCIVSTTKHVCAIIDGKLNDTFDGRVYDGRAIGLDEYMERKAMSVWVNSIQRS